ncbi:MAG: hypothetical protein ACTSUV_06845 [Candidatus Ranarchaeia archaeon]
MGERIISKEERELIFEILNSQYMAINKISQAFVVLGQKHPELKNSIESLVRSNKTITMKLEVLEKTLPK